jgi:2-keto-4-pentenoate hydratase
VEVEFCFTAQRDLTAGMSREELLASCTVAGDMEVPDARYANSISPVRASIELTRASDSTR